MESLGKHHLFMIVWTVLHVAKQVAHKSFALLYFALLHQIRGIKPARKEAWPIWISYIFPSLVSAGGHPAYGMSLLFEQICFTALQLQSELSTSLIGPTSSDSTPASRKHAKLEGAVGHAVINRCFQYMPILRPLHLIRDMMERYGHRKMKTYFCPS